jgi:hypothetical protein
MTDRTCARIQRHLIDSLGARDGLPPSDLRHLETCDECGRFLVLHGLLAERREAPPPDYRSVDLAFEEAGRIGKRKKDAREIAAFLSVGLCVTGGLGTAGILGFGIIVLALQAVIYFTLPLSALFVLRERMKAGRV